MPHMPYLVTVRRTVTQYAVVVIDNANDAAQACYIAGEMEPPVADALKWTNGPDAPVTAMHARNISDLHPEEPTR